MAVEKLTKGMINLSGLKTHGITTETIKNMLLNAGVLYKNLKYDSETKAWSGTPFGATSGGIKFNYEAKWLDIEVDGATVLVKGISKQKVGEAAYFEGSMTEITPGLLADAMHLKKEDTKVEGYTVYKTIDNLTEADYPENIAYVGTLSGGKQIIIILPHAICTEAFEFEAKNAEQSTFKVKFECTADFNNNTLNKLDLELYYPDSTETQTTGE